MALWPFWTRTLPIRDLSLSTMAKTMTKTTVVLTRAVATTRTRSSETQAPPPISVVVASSNVFAMGSSCPRRDSTCLEHLLLCLSSRLDTTRRQGVAIHHSKIQQQQHKLKQLCVIIIIVCIYSPDNGRRLSAYFVRSGSFAPRQLDDGSVGRQNWCHRRSVSHKSTHSLA